MSSATNLLFMTAAINAAKAARKNAKECKGSGPITSYTPTKISAFEAFMFSDKWIDGATLLGLLILSVGLFCGFLPAKILGGYTVFHCLSAKVILFEKLKNKKDK